MLEIRNLTVNNENRTILNDIHLNIHDSKINAIIGPSGSGKSLTGKAIVDFIPENLETSDYEVYIKGEKVKNIKKLLGKTIGVITQDYSSSFNEHQTIGKQLIRIYRYHNKVSKKEAKEKVIHSLSHVNLDANTMKKYSFNLSGGQLQRVQIASVLMLEPDLIIADEITSSLDKMTGKKIMDIVQHISEDHKQTFLLITHDISHVEKYADYITVMREGNIIMSDKSEKVFSSDNEYVKDALFKLNIRSERND